MSIAKQTGNMKMSEGRVPMKFATYKYLAMIAMCNKCDSGYYLSIMCHLFLVLPWNLMGRCTSIADLMYEHIVFAEDNIEFRFPMHKSDQEGKICFPINAFANLECPEIFPILSLALYQSILSFQSKFIQMSVHGKLAILYYVGKVSR